MELGFGQRVLLKYHRLRKYSLCFSYCLSTQNCYVYCLTPAQTAEQRCFAKWAQKKVRRGTAGESKDRGGKGTTKTKGREERGKER